MKVKTRYKILKKPKQLKKLIQYCKETKYASVDFETNAKGFYNLDSFPTLLGVSFQIGSCWVIPLAHKDSPFRTKKEEFDPLEEDTWVKLLKEFGREVISNPDIVKIGQNFKFETQWFKKYGIEVKGVVLDTMLAKYTLDEERPNDLKSLTKRFLPEFGGYEDEMADLIKKYGWENAPIKPLSKYNAVDCDVAFRLMVFFENIIIEKGYYKLYRNMSMAVSKVLSDVEFRGNKIDEEYLDTLITETEKYIVWLEKKLRKVKTVKKYEKYRKKKAIKNLIKETKADIKSIRNKGKTLKGKAIANRETAIKNRESKVSRYIAGEFTTRNERKTIAPINFKSPDQLKELFFFSKKGFRFEIVKYTKDKKTKQETENPSTDEEVLLELHKQDKTGFMDTLLELRGINTVYSTFMVGIKEKLSYDNYIHTSYKIHGTVTGRLSSTNPNMQNIPRVTTMPLVKPMFIPPPGYLILEVDYSQAELRVVAEMAKDKAMIQIFKEGQNIHTATGLKMEGCPEMYDVANVARKDENHPEHIKYVKIHKKGKVMNFSILYEQGDDMTANALGVSLGEAKQFKKDWLDQFPQVAKWRERQHKKAYNKGYVETLFGRKRRLPNIYLEDEDRGKFAEAKRQSVNAPIQGSSSDFTTFSQVIIDEEIMKGNLPRDIHEIYTVHDSIGFWIRPKHLKYIPQIIELCANPETKKYFNFQMKHVRMKVSAELGIHWGAMNPYNPETDYEELMMNQDREEKFNAIKDYYKTLKKKK